MNGEQRWMQPLPGPDAVRALVGSSLVDAPTDPTSIGQLIGRAARAARAVTGGGGFDATGSATHPDIAEVLVRSVARCLLNPEVSLAESAPPFTVRPGSFPDWSEAELVVLQRFRDRVRADDR